MDDDIPRRLYVGIGKEHEVDGGIAECRGSPHLILHGQCSEIGEYDDNGFHLEYTITNVLQK